MADINWKKVVDRGVPIFYAEYGYSQIPDNCAIFPTASSSALRRAYLKNGGSLMLYTQDAYAYHVLKELWRCRIPVVVSQHWTVFMERKTREHCANTQPADGLFSHEPFNFTTTNSLPEISHYNIQAAVTWLPNAVDTEIFHPPQQPERKFWLLHASGMTRRRDSPISCRHLRKCDASGQEPFCSCWRWCRSN